MAHAELGPSSAKRWMTCPGSVRMSRGLENKTSRYADEGTEAHALGEAILRARLDPTPANARASVEAQLLATVDMLDAVAVYVGKVMSYVVAGLEVVILLEQSVSLEALGVPVWGTGDLVAFVPALRRMIVGDYKHGAGVAVEVEANPQLMIYALGAWLSIAGPRGWRVEHVETFICQPRKEHDLGPVRTHTYTLAEMLDFAQDVIEAAEATEAPDAPLVAGDHCRFCRAKALCPTRVAAMNQVVTVPEFQGLPPASAMSIGQAVAILEAADRVKFADWLDDVRGFLQQHAEAGGSVPGYKLVAKRANRQWRVNDKEIVERLVDHASAMDLFEYPEPYLKSPAQVEKIVGKKNLPADLTFKESTGYNLVPESAKGEAVQVHPGDEFAAIEAPLQD
ncbi:DUF2800 domain-containing protein [Paraburkholderia sp. RL18-103-BIB-C]|uniref:DUF2800 domain-containing protein n=1 Tax=Paraburkholderia sp. RL18-103-BIB-C TaxID=3031637 RepID=UPI0038B8E53C